MCFRENYCEKAYLRRNSRRLQKKKKKKSGAEGPPCYFIQKRSDRYLLFANVAPIKTYCRTLMPVLLGHIKKLQQRKCIKETLGDIKNYSMTAIKGYLFNPMFYLLCCGPKSPTVPNSNHSRHAYI